MIVNNYDNSLKENEKTELTFTDWHSPRLIPQYFPKRVNYNEKLVIPYRVLPFSFHDLGKEITDPERMLGEYKDYCTYTYTTIAHFDCRKATESPYSRKATTYSGEYCIELGPFTKADCGEHFVALETIQSDGNSSIKHFFKVMIDDPEEEIGCVDLSTLTGFTSSYPSGTNPSEGNTFDNSSSRYRIIDKHAIKEVTVADYTVSKEQDGDDVRIRIDVSGTLYRYYISTWQLYVDPIDITRTYYLTTYCYDDDNNKYVLKDYLKKQPTFNDIGFNFKTQTSGPGVGEFADNYYIPPCVLAAAADNKNALMMLMMAARAHIQTTRCELKFIENVPLVVDYHAVKLVDNTLRIVPNTVTTITIPNNFILNLNNSSIYTLQSVDISSGWLLVFNDNFNCCIKNGGVYGQYKYTQFENQEIYYSGGKARTRRFPETLSLTCIGGTSSFCTFENITTAWSNGYDAYIGGDSQPSTWSYHMSPIYMPLYDICGYVDFCGNTHITKESCYDGALELRHTSRFAPFREAWADKLFGPQYMFVKTDGSSQGERHRTSREIIVHYYDIDYNFICTDKVDDVNVVIFPENAYYLKLSVHGSLIKSRPPDINTIRTGEGDRGTLMPCARGTTWSSGYKNCKIHEMRSSLFDNSKTKDCFCIDCYMWDIAAERHKNETENGYSTQTCFIDIEDSTIDNTGFALQNCENIYGRSTTLVHASDMLLFTYNKNISFTIDKANYGNTVANNIIPVYIIANGFSTTVRYDKNQNNRIYAFSNIDSEHGTLGETCKETFLEYCDIYRLNNKDGKNNLYPVYLKDTIFREYKYE